MGMGISALATINALRAEGVILARGRIIEIGAQQLSGDLLRHREVLEDSRVQFGAAQGYPFPEAKRRVIVHGSQEHLPEDAPPTKLFWEWAGYVYACVDIDDTAHSIPLDLNFDTVSPDLKGTFDLVTNFGTTEHVANQLNAFRIIHDFAKPGGLMMHELPAQGFANHGLVNYNPKFFWLLARSNGYKWVHMDYWADATTYSLPEGIIDHAGQFSAAAKRRLASAQIVDCSVKVVLRKVHDMDFVPPIDVPSMARTDNPLLKERYWTVFDPGHFQPPYARLYRRLHPFIPNWLYRLARGVFLDRLLQKVRKALLYS